MLRCAGNRMRGKLFFTWFAIAGMVWCTPAAGAMETIRPATVEVVCIPQEPPLVFAAGEIRQALEQVAPATTVSDANRPSASAVGHDGFRIVILVVGTAEGDRALRRAGVALEARPTEQGYMLKKTVQGNQTTWWAIGSDLRGAMYAGLEAAEQIRLGGLGAMCEVNKSPFLVRRGIKFNIPLDARTPSYDDGGHAAQTNIVHMWDFAFWERFLDQMARYRYNALTLWNPHPFPSLVKLPDYPEIPLSDVCVCTLDPSQRPGAWRTMFATEEALRNLKVVKSMPIEEKIDFWRRVMRHAKDRGIEVYFITWNVVVNAAEGKYGITAEQDNPKTIAYLRQCVREMILTYPDLTGIGVTAGEHMQHRSDQYAKEKWLWNSYGLGVLDAKKRQPDRNVRFIHRVWQTGVDEVMQEFGSKYPDDFEMSFKYARAHLYSSPRIPFADELCEQLRQTGQSCWWNLRNDDIFVFRWGDPDYVRCFLRNLPQGVTAGYHMGSDGYVWGVEFGSLQPDTPRQLEIDKHWYNFMLWGRLGYDPWLGREFFQRVLHERFPEAPPAALFDAWQAASKIIPLVNRFHWRDWDFMWTPEGCMDHKGFHTVDQFIDIGPMERSGLISVPDFVDALLAARTPAGMTPLQVADRLDQLAQAAMGGAMTVRQQAKEPSRELESTLCDMEAMGHLGRYYAAKIRGAVELCVFRRSGESQRKTVAVDRLLEAQGHWQRYAESAAAQYRPQMLARTRQLDWKAALAEVAADVEIARSAQADSSKRAN